ncbi:MAG TPA: nucleoside 2-deoxyribosyltransferase [Anaerovoracaceae bacterium]|nr:nucleoside 2-deoxyribosyltransferase [Anaerovoracaceae bacterium]
MIKSIYLAGPWAYRDLAKQVRNHLVGAGIEVTSRWLDFPGDSHDPEVLQREAINDLEDVRKADALVLLNLQKRGEETSGKAVETGYALALGKPVYMVGNPSNVFHWLPEVNRYNTIDELTNGLKG